MAIVSTNLKIKTNVCESDNCRWLELRDGTGIYDSVTNPGGWDATGVANPSAADVTDVTITIIDPNDVTYSITVDDISAPLDYLPDPNGEKVFVITSVMLGLASTAKLIDGIYDITVTYSGDFGANTYINASSNCKILVSCQANCCIKQLEIDALKADCEGCLNTKLDIAIEARNTLRFAKIAAACGQPNKAKKLLAKAQWICNSYNCSNC